MKLRSNLNGKQRGRLAGGGFQKELSELSIDVKILKVVYVSNDELIWLYRNCYANPYPSLFEGFGLPVHEGVQFGAPMLTSNSTSISEVAGKAAIMLILEGIEGWAQAMLRLVANRMERDQLSAAARKHVDRFDWKVNVAGLLQLYEEALASTNRRVGK